MITNLNIQLNSHANIDHDFSPCENITNSVHHSSLGKERVRLTNELYWEMERVLAEELSKFNSDAWKTPHFKR